MKLFKRQDRYDLYADTDHKVASSAPNPFGKLSKQNCDEIFGVINVEKLAKEVLPNDDTTSRLSQQKGFIEGFNKAMELNKGKRFTSRDMLGAYIQGTNDGAEFESMMDYDQEDNNETYEFAEEAEKEFIESLQQPTEIEVTFNPDEKDSDGCLILSKL